MDPDIRRWVLEFLLMSSVPDSIVKDVWIALPLSGNDSRLAKMLALRSIQSEVAKASFTEKSLECLEIIEEIDRLDDIAITKAMKEAYCAVAVECSVRYLEGCPHKNSRGLFDDAVNRIWRGRVRKMMEAMASSEKRCHLFTAELIEWKDVIESARWDAEVCRRLMDMNARQNALVKVRVYLKEAWESMGPSFLELAASSLANEGYDKGVSESALVFDKMNTCKGRLHCSTNTTEEGLVLSDGNALNNAAICTEKAPEAGANQENEELGKRVVSSIGGNQALDETDLPHRISVALEKGKQPLEHNHAAPSTRRGVKIIDAEEVLPTAICNKDHNASNVQFEKLRKSLMSSSLELQALVKDPLPEALQKSDIVRSELATGVNHEPHFGNRSTVVNVPEPNTCRSIVVYQPISDILKKQSSANCSNVRRPSWMERNSTAHTYEWDDPFDNLPEGGHKKRRRKAKWSSEEEDALRDGVKKFGRGNWKPILKFHSGIFSKTGRTEVDLKDKWRNLTRWS